MNVRNRLSTIFAAAALVATACAPTIGPESSASSPASSVIQPITRKVVTFADGYEPKAITETFVPGHQSSGNNVKLIVQDALVSNPQFQVYEPQLATELPSLDKSTWKLNPDGTVETIWRLRPNVKWHDGQPFTADDLVFTFQVSRDTSVAGVAVTPTDRLIDSVSASDPLTFVMHWNAPYAVADRTSVGDILPKHLLADLYQTDKTSFANSAVFSTEFIGLGPFRMVRWDQGSQVEAARFDDYYRGRPALDTIIVRFVSDPNALVAMALAGTADAVLSGASGSSLSLDQALEVKKRWEGTGNQVLTSQTGNVLWTEAQFNTDYARPPGVLADVVVRQALLQGIDRQSLTDVMTNGLSQVADSFYLPGEPLRSELESSIAKYPYDATRAAQLLTQAGWTRGADGVLARGSDGQRMELDFWAREGATDKVAAIITDDWKRLGVVGTPYIIPAARRTDREYEAKRPGFLCCVRVGYDTFHSGKLHQRQIPTAATNWNGINYGGYVNPRADAIVDTLNSTIDPKARLPLERDLVHEYTANVAILPMWWEIFPILLVEGVNGPRPNFMSATANMFEWDRVL